MNKKIYLVLILTTFTVCNLFSQNNTSVYVPDLQTDVEGSTLKATENDLPDFSTVLSVNNKNDDVKIVLPNSVEGGEDNIIENEKREMEKTFAVDGLIGGSYPLGFIGDFCIYSIYGKDPFKIDFKHNSMTGYANNNLSSGFNDRNTSVLIEKEFNFDEASIKLGGSFDDEGKGLQNKSLTISDINQETGKVFAQINIDLPNGIFVHTGLNGELYDRFSSILNYTPTTILDTWISNNMMLSLSPNIYLGAKINNFVFGAKADYDFEYNINNAVSEIYSVNTGNRLNRGEFTFITEWNNDYVNLFGNVSIVVGDHIGQNSFIIPFTLGTDFNFPVYFSTRKMKFAVQGGVDSNHKLISELESEYGFSAISLIPYETTNAYVKGELFIPIINTMEIDFNVDYARTLYGNGVWCPTYEITSLKNGFFTYTKKEQHVFKTDLAFSLNYKMFMLELAWKANWLDCPITEEINTFNIKTGLNGDIWNVTASLEYSPAASDSTPIVGIETFVKINPKIQLNLSFEDMIKLFTGEERYFINYYAARGGCVNASVKFSL